MCMCLYRMKLKWLFNDIDTLARYLTIALNVLFAIYMLSHIHTDTRTLSLSHTHTPIDRILWHCRMYRTCIVASASSLAIIVYIQHVSDVISFLYFFFLACLSLFSRSLFHSLPSPFLSISYFIRFRHCLVFLPSLPLSLLYHFLPFAALIFYFVYSL